MVVSPLRFAQARAHAAHATALPVGVCPQHLVLDAPGGVVNRIGAAYLQCSFTNSRVRLVAETELKSNGAVPAVLRTDAY
jgi:hypothetical protein